MSRQRAEVDLGTELARSYRSGDLSRRAFSEAAGITVSALDYYLRRDKERLRKKQRLLPVVVTEEREASQVAEIVVVVGNGRRVEVGRGFDAELLLRLLGVLERA